MLSTPHKLRSGFGRLPRCNCRHAVADDRAHPTDEPRHGEHLGRDLAAALHDLLFLLFGAGFDPGDAECAWNCSGARGCARAGAERKWTNGAGLNDHVEPQRARQSSRVKVALHGADFLAFDANKVRAWQRDRGARRRQAVYRAVVGAPHQPLGRNHPIPVLGGAYEVEGEIGKGGPKRFGVHADRCVRKRPLRRRVGVSATVRKGGDQSCGVVLVPRVEITLNYERNLRIHWQRVANCRPDLPENIWFQTVPPTDTDVANPAMLRGWWSMSPGSCPLRQARPGRGDVHPEPGVRLSAARTCGYQTQRL